MKNIKDYPRTYSMGTISGERPTGQKFAVYQDGKLYKIDYTELFLYFVEEIEKYMAEAE